MSHQTGKNDRSRANAPEASRTGRLTRRTLAPTAAANRPDGPERAQAAASAPAGAAVRARLIETAIRLFCQHGVGATGVNAIVDESGVARMTLYSHFGSKEGLALAALEHEAATWRAWFFARLAETGGSPRDRLLAVFDILEEWFARDDYFGCALMNAVIEGRNRDEAILALTKTHKSHVLEQLRALAAAAGATDPEALADCLDLLIDGAIVKSAIKRDASPALEAKALATALFASLPMN